MQSPRVAGCREFRQPLVSRLSFAFACCDGGCVIHTTALHRDGLCTPPVVSKDGQLTVSCAAVGRREPNDGRNRASRSSRRPGQSVTSPSTPGMPSGGRSMLLEINGR